MSGCHVSLPAGIPIPPKQNDTRNSKDNVCPCKARAWQIWQWSYARVSNSENIVWLKSLWIYHLVMTNIAMENPLWRFVAGKIIYKWAMFHGYVK